MPDSPKGSQPELLLLGGIELRGAPPEAARELLAQPKVTAFLAYLTLAPDRLYQRRDLLAALLWPELDQSHARTQLRRAVHQVRSALGPETVVARGDEEVAIPATRLETDVERFVEAADAGELIPALDLYRGELMPGFHVARCAELGMWLDECRRAMHERAAAAAWALAVRLETDEEFTEAGRWARRAVHYTGADERVLRRAMRMLDRLGDRTGALQLCDEFSHRVRQTLNVELSPETQTLVESLRAG